MKWWTDRYPGVEFIEGPATARDAFGTAYLKIALGGPILDGGTQPSMSNANSAQLMEHFDMEFRKVLKDSKVVYVRRWPEIEEHIRYELETFDTDSPRLVPRRLMTVSGRFTFYKEKP